MSSPKRRRFRIVIPNVGTATRVVPVSDPIVGKAWQRGVIRRVRATIDSTTDTTATPGTTAATDIHIFLAEGGSAGAPASGMGDAARRSIPYDKPVGVAPSGTTIDHGSGITTMGADPALDVDYFVPENERLSVGVALDLMVGGVPDATVVVTLVIEEG